MQQEVNLLDCRSKGSNFVTSPITVSAMLFLGVSQRQWAGPMDLYGME